VDGTGDLHVIPSKPDSKSKVTGFLSFAEFRTVKTNMNVKRSVLWGGTKRKGEGKRTRRWENMIDILSINVLK
jgi:hypothetical protein